MDDGVHKDSVPFARFTVPASYATFSHFVLLLCLLLYASA
jgi:hypothetical protein